MKIEDQISRIKSADRLVNVSEYYFSEKLKEVTRMNAGGKDAISLGIGSPDIPPSENTIQTLCDVARNPGGHDYQSYVGIPELRRGPAGWHRKQYGVELDPNMETQPLIGSKEDILHVALALVSPGEQVLVPSPGCPTYASLSKILGVKVINYDLKEENDWMSDFSELKKVDMSRVKLAWTNYLSMFTGANTTPRLYRKLVDFACRKDIVIVNNNLCSSVPNEHSPSILSVPGTKECCVELNPMSKSHNTPDWHIGTFASNADLVRWILKVKSNMDGGMLHAMQLAVATALEAGEERYEDNSRSYRGRRRLADEIMHELGYTYDENQVDMLLWGKIPDSCAGVEELTERVLYEAHIFITPEFIFGSNGRKYIRTSLCCKDNRPVEALKHIKEMK